MSYEDNFLNSLGNKSEVNFMTKEKTIFSLEEKSFLEQRLAEMRDAELLEEDFIKREEDGTSVGRYEASSVLIDQKEVNDRAIGFEQKNKIEFLKKGPVLEKVIKERMKIAEYYEAFFFQNAGGEDGIFPGAVIYKTSRTDDFNGIDFIVETDKEHLGIATDVTMVSNMNDLRNKLDRSKLDIERGVFAEIKYFDTENPEEKLKVPRAVVAAKYESVVRTLKLWAQNEEDHALTTGMKIKSLLEMRAQFEAGLEYSKAINRREHQAVFGKRLDALNNALSIYSEKELSRYVSKIEEDPSYQFILSWADSLKQETQKIIKERGNE